MIASYSASLLEAWKPNLRAYSISIPSGKVRISSALLPWALTAPSTDNLQMGRSGASWVAPIDCAGVNSMMKYVKICPFTAILGLYLMSNSLSSIAHFINLPEISGLCSICFNRIFGWDFDGMSLEVRSEFSGCGYQRQDQLFHL